MCKRQTAPRDQLATLPLQPIGVRSLGSRGLCPSSRAGETRPPGGWGAFGCPGLPAWSRALRYEEGIPRQTDRDGPRLSAGLSESVPALGQWKLKMYQRAPLCLMNVHLTSLFLFALRSLRVLQGKLLGVLEWPGKWHFSPLLGENTILPACHSGNYTGAVGTGTQVCAQSLSGTEPSPAELCPGDTCSHWVTDNSSGSAVPKG